ncbi:unnamed protein product [Closterium sp. Yama58-4]|nr:unnamed protein product [Closterium sp. Yama58-4]
MPYNYVLDQDYRRNLKVLEMRGAVLIFDEAHNLERLLADQASVQLSTSLLSACAAEAAKCVAIATARVAFPPSSSQYSEGGSYIYEFLAQLNINHVTVMSLFATVQHALLLLTDDAAAFSPGEAEAGGAAEAGGDQGNAGAEGGGASGRGAGNPAMSFRLEQLWAALQLIFPPTGPTSHASSFKVCITERRVKARKNASVAAPSVVRTLNWWCFDPGLVMQQIRVLGVRSMLLTSGTLSPLQPYASELRVPFQQQLENSHVISQEQVWAGVLPVGPSGVALNSGFKTRSQHDYLHDMGSAIVNICRIVPGGVLVFFPSYSCMDSSIQAWQLPPAGRHDSAALSVWQRIGMQKQPVVEPRDSALLGEAREDYVRKLEEEGSKGTVLFAVCRGKVSEGIDFADHLSRAVVITGIPYAQQLSPQVVLKKEYLDERVTAHQHHLYQHPDAVASMSPVSGAQWYTLDAIRAVNQAVGRVIRHRLDFGSIILLDERFAEPKLKDRLSMWIRPALKVYSGFGKAAFSLTKFFRSQPNGAHPKPACPDPTAPSPTHSPTHMHPAAAAAAAAPTTGACPMSTKHAAEAAAAGLPGVDVLPPFLSSQSLLDADPLLVPAANEVSAARRQGAATRGKASSGDGNEGVVRDRNAAGGDDRSQAGGEVKLEGGTAGKNSRVPSLFSTTIPRLPVTSTSSLLAAACAHDGGVEDKGGMGRRGAGRMKCDGAERRMEGGDAAMRIGGVEMRMNGGDSERKMKGGDAGNRKASGEGSEWNEQQTERGTGSAGAGEALGGAAVGDGDCLRDPGGCGSGGAPPRTGAEAHPMGLQQAGAETEQMGLQQDSRGASRNEDSLAGPRGECLASEGFLRSRRAASCQGNDAWSTRAAGSQGSGAGSLATREGSGAKRSRATREEENRRARDSEKAERRFGSPQQQQQQQQPVFSSASQPAAVPVGDGAVLSGGAVLATRTDLLHSLASLFAASNQLPLLAGFDAFLSKQEDKATLKELLGETAG